MAEALTSLVNEPSTAPFFAEHHPQLAVALASALAAGKSGEVQEMSAGALPGPLHDVVVAVVRPMLQDEQCAAAVLAAANAMTPEAQAELQAYLYS